VVVLWWLSGTLLLSGKSNPNNTGGCIYWNPNTTFILCFCVYVPPGSNGDYYVALFSYIRSLPITTHNVIIYGDFNFPDVNWFTMTSSTDVSAQFCDLLFDLILSQLIFTHTHIKGNILNYK
jgi:hypothetical protein